MKVTARNQFTGKIVAIEKGSVNGIVKIDIGGGQFIDLGAPVLNGMAIPAIVKTLIFDS